MVIQLEETSRWEHVEWAPGPSYPISSLSCHQRTVMLQSGGEGSIRAKRGEVVLTRYYKS